MTVRYQIRNQWGIKSPFFDSYEEAFAYKETEKENMEVRLGHAFYIDKVFDYTNIYSNRENVYFEFYQQVGDNEFTWSQDFETILYEIRQVVRLDLESTPFFKVIEVPISKYDVSESLYRVREVRGNDRFIEKSHISNISFFKEQVQSPFFFLKGGSFFFETYSELEEIISILRPSRIKMMENVINLIENSVTVLEGNTEEFLDIFSQSKMRFFGKYNSPVENGSYFRIRMFLDPIHSVFRTVFGLAEVVTEYIDGVEHICFREANHTDYYDSLVKIPKEEGLSELTKGFFIRKDNYSKTGAAYLLYIDRRVYPTHVSAYTVIKEFQDYLLKDMPFKRTCCLHLLNRLKNDGLLSLVEIY